MYQIAPFASLTLLTKVLIYKKPSGIKQESIKTPTGIYFTYFYTVIYINGQYNISTAMHNYDLWMFKIYKCQK